jgi:hypothetical protein
MRPDEGIAFQRAMLIPDGTADADLVNTWQNAATEVNGLAALPGGQVHLQALSTTAQAVADQVSGDDLFRQLFPGAHEWYSVPIDELLSIQPYIDREFVESLTPPSQTDEAAVIGFCMRANPLDPPLVANDGQVTFSSHFKNNLFNPGLAVEKVNDNTYKVSALIISRPNFMYVAEIQGRYMLANGYHRALALLAAGHTRVPCLVRHFADHSQAFQPGLGFFDAAHLARPRPPLVSDFVNRPAGIVDFEMTGRAHVMRVGLQVSQFEAPR